jgi:23S rRNA (cytidine1920-2'-O)/16S rRNA (cytidine1409-2'-O)-methyltransferase
VDLDEARSLVATGRVLVGGAPALSPTRGVAPGEPVVVVEPARFVGRGGEKLAAALETFGVGATGTHALDVGASTGGFTDCLLAAGAARVLAVDVGHGQLHERLRSDPRVVSLERTNVRDLGAAAVAELLGAPPTVVVVDLSFTSLVPHLAHVVSIGADEATYLALVKPQFEVAHVTASRGRGIVRDPAEWRATVLRCASALETAGAGIMGVMASPLRGTGGNAEFFVHARRGAARSGLPGIIEQVDRAVTAAGAP